MDTVQRAQDAEYPGLTRLPSDATLKTGRDSELNTVNSEPIGVTAE